MMRKPASLLLAVALGALVIAGCGGGSGGSKNSGDRAAFCLDNETLTNDVAGAKSLADIVKAFKANVAVIDDFEQQAPSDIKADAKTLADAAHKVISTSDAKSFASSAISDAGNRVDTYCQGTGPPTS